MQQQDDPFRTGGVISSFKLSLSMIVTHLVAGSACMSFLSAFSWDWQLARGKAGCRVGAFTLYYGCRYLSILSVLSTMVFLDAFPVTLVNPLRYISQIAASLSLGLAYCILLVRIGAMYKNIWLCVGLDLLKVICWGIMWKTIVDTPGVVAFHPGTMLAEAIYNVFVPSLMFVASLFFALYVRREDHHFKPREMYRTCEREDIFEFAFAWGFMMAAGVRKHT
ncbi:hypothetical protein C8Q78DRAFT_976883 [Trametes maxima]|nr:hypothetical protein C8Q78DRAFT_976883 [Trametes maxima]